MKKFRLILWTLSCLALCGITSCEKNDNDGPEPTKEERLAVIGFENITLSDTGVADNYLYISDSLAFYNKYDQQWKSYEGFGYSNQTDTTNGTYDNQFSVYGKGGAAGSKQFAVFYNSYADTIHCQFVNGIRKTFESVMINNSAYAALTIRNGNYAAKKFVAGDWFKVTIVGYVGTDNLPKPRTAAKENTRSDYVPFRTVSFYLADFRDGKSYICNEWSKIDLRPLGKVNHLKFIFSSSDTGQYGINTPCYVCIDNLTYVAEEI